MSITLKLKQIMLNEGISQATLAREAGVTEGAVSGWMNGAKPRRSALIKLASSFKYDLLSLENDDMKLKKLSYNNKLEKTEFDKDIADKLPYGIFNAEDAINSVEDLYGDSFDSRTRLLLNIIQANEYGFDFYKAIKIAKENGDMQLASVLLFFDKLRFSGQILGDMEVDGDK